VVKRFADYWGSMSFSLATVHFKRVIIVWAAVFAVFQPQPAHAESFEDALAMAYSSNPALQAERAKLRSVDESVAAAVGDLRPQITAQANAGVSWQVYDKTSANLTPTDAGVTVTQPLYNGGGTLASIHQAEESVRQERATLMTTEQTVLVGAATAYLDVVQDTVIRDLYAGNEDTLKSWVDEAKQRFSMGEKTRTDVSQAESRLARAHADRNSAEQNLSIARNAYIRYVGQVPGAMAQPSLTPVLPSTRDEAADWARRSAPTVDAASHAERAAKANITVARSNLLPVLSLQGSLNNARDENIPETGISTNRTVNDQLLLQIKIPLTVGGGEYARVRAAYQNRSQKRDELTEAQREACETALQAWDQMQAATSNISWRQSQVTAAIDTLEGMKQEERAGDRSSTDTLNAQQELLDSRVSAIQAEHDKAVATVQLMAALGQFTAQSLKLKVDIYDPNKHYLADKTKWFGTGSHEN
jgi:outer membrane protein